MCNEFHIVTGEITNFALSLGVTNNNKKGYQLNNIAITNKNKLRFRNKKLSDMRTVMVNKRGLKK
jgi:hypothetical protein